MKNIIKSQLYQLKKERLIVIVFLGITAVMLVNALTGTGSGETLCGSEYVAQVMKMQSIIALLYVFVQAGISCCSDFLDKTANYEIMSGHTRKEVYLGRIIPCIVIGMLGWLFIMIMPYILCTALEGWGTKLSLGIVVLRLLLMLFPVLRIICEFILISFIVRNQYIVMGAGYAVFCIGGVSEAFADKGSFLLGVTNMTLLAKFDTWMTFGLSGTENYIYESALNASDIAGTVIFSLIFSAASLYMGYYFFRTDDVN